MRARRPHSRPHPDPAPAKPTEVACSLPEDQLAERRQALRAGLLCRLVEARDLDQGVALRFAPGDAAEVEAFVAFERGCCGFATYRVRAEPDALWLEITGPEGTGAFLRRMVAPAER